jgi:hypothetical protein
MNHGGIFSGPTALGTVDRGIFRNPVGLGAVDQKCSFRRWWPLTGNEAARAIQTEMVRRGAKGLKVDGLWGNCSESAYQKLFKEPLTKESVLKNFNVNCTSFTKDGGFAPSKCTNGTDAVTKPPAETGPPAPSPPAPGPGQPAEPPPVICQEGYIHDPVSGGCKEIPGGRPPLMEPKCKRDCDQTDAIVIEEDKTAPAQWIDGVSNKTVIGVGIGVALIGVGAFVLTRKS